MEEADSLFHHAARDECLAYIAWLLAQLPPTTRSRENLASLTPFAKDLHIALCAAALQQMVGSAPAPAPMPWQPRAIYGDAHSISPRSPTGEIVFDAMDHLRLPAISDRGPSRDRPIDQPWDLARTVAVITSEKKVEAKARATRTVQVRCPNKHAGCSPRGKLLATLADIPVELFGSGAIIRIACPKKKSRLIQIRL
jgi:hypothetical protein